MSATKELVIHKFRNGMTQEVTDVMSVEEPLEIILNYKIDGKIISNPISITMRTPGNDKELAVGFLFTESIIKDYYQIEKIQSLIENRTTVFLKENTMIDLEKLKRNFYTTSSCGVCGKSSLEAVKTIQSTNHIQSSVEIQVSSSMILSLKNKINESQSNFSQTGGIHASALFDQEGNLISLFEDVGRHNALDKLIGHHVIEGHQILSNYVLLLSGRASFELIQKAAMAGIQVVCAIGAPSSLAVELAQEFNITLIGFLKNESFNIYSSSHRIIENR